MSKPVILINSCKPNRDRGCNSAIRETWGIRARIPYYFILGKGNSPLYGIYDELFFDVIDDYWGQAWKNRESLRWALAQGYDQFFLAADDTYIDTNKLLSNIPSGDYVGNCEGTPKCPEKDGVPFDYCHGGPGYWVSKRMAEVLSRHEINTDIWQHHRLCDQWVGSLMAAADIEPVYDPRYSMGKSYGFDQPSVRNDNDIITCHLGSGPGKYQPQHMKDADFNRMHVLIAVNSCWRDIRNGSNQAIRDTWAKTLPAGWDLRFFVGDRNFTEEEESRLFTPEWLGSPGTLGAMHKTTGGRALIGEASELQPDEVLLECSDQYLGLTFKTIESLRWAMERNYDYVLRCFTDTYVFGNRLADSDFQEHDASGWVFGCGPCAAHMDSSHTCPLGGSGYWLSARAAQVVIDEPPKHWGEDTTVGFALDKADIPLYNEKRFVYRTNDDPISNRSKLTIHLCDRGTKWEPKLMYETHQQQMASAKVLPFWNGMCKKCGHDKTARNVRGLRCARCGEWAA